MQTLPNVHQTCRSVYDSSFGLECTHMGALLGSAEARSSLLQTVPTHHHRQCLLAEGWDSRFHTRKILLCDRSHLPRTFPPFGVPCLTFDGCKSHNCPQGILLFLPVLASPQPPTAPGYELLAVPNTPTTGELCLFDASCCPRRFFQCAQEGYVALSTALDEKFLKLSRR